MKLPIYLVLIKANDQYYLKSDDEGTIENTETALEWIRYYEDGYNAAHRRSYESSMSALINAISIQPSIVRIDSLEEITSRFIGEDGYKICTRRNVSGGFTGITSGRDLSEEWEKGIKPRLCSV